MANTEDGKKKKEKKIQRRKPGNNYRNYKHTDPLILLSHRTYKNKVAYKQVYSTEETIQESAIGESTIMVHPHRGTLYG